MRTHWLVILLLCSLGLYAQHEHRMPVKVDTVIVVNDEQDLYNIADTFHHAQRVPIEDLYWRPDPLKATWLAAIVPGLGQIYNRSYWKLPIVYGAFMGCIYAITWNNMQYDAYKQAYRDILVDETLSTDPSCSYISLLPKGYTIETMGGREQYTSTLNSRQNLYRRYRDIAIAATAVVYVLTIVDAYVDAQLFDFDISPDLSLNVNPEIYYDIQTQRAAGGVHLAIKF